MSNSTTVKSTYSYLHTSTQEALKANNSFFITSLRNQIRNELEGLGLQEDQGSGSSLERTKSTLSKRDFGMDVFIPNSLEGEELICLRSNKDGNCLYSAVAVALNKGGNAHILLRLLTSIELYEKASFYSKYPYFLKLFEKNKDAFKSLYSIFSCSLSFDCVDEATVQQKYAREHEIDLIKIIKKEAIKNCELNRFSSFICLIAISSVIRKNIVSHYPDCGLYKYKLIFNTTISPRTSLTSKPGNVQILWCNTDIETLKLENWSPNHFVPLVKKNKVASDKVSVGKKRSSKLTLPQLEKCSGLQTKIGFVKKASIPDISKIKIGAVSTKNKQQMSQTKIKYETISIPKDSESEHHQTSPSNGKEVSQTSTTPIIFDTEEKFDVAFYFEKGKKLTAERDDAELQSLIKNVWVPSATFQFPNTVVTPKKRHFKLSWLENYKWLAYSKKEDGAYCLYCTLFGSGVAQIQKSKTENFCSRPFKSWSNANKVFHLHNLSQFHKHCEDVASVLQSRCESRSVGISTHINKTRCALIEENRKKIRPIVKTIIFAAQQNYAFRGHRDDTSFQPEIGDTTQDHRGVGNFIALLNFRVDSGDKDLKNHLLNAPKNARYTSKTTQNDIIDCCAQVIEETLISEFRSAKYFSVMADEAADCSNKEQMSIVIRFIDGNNDIREEFIRFAECTSGTTGMQLSAIVLKTLQDFGLDIQKCRGQGYDGAAAMSGVHQGVASRILSLNHKALYFHCSSHLLSLVVSKASKIQEVQNIFEQVRDITSFFSVSVKRTDCLKGHLIKGSPKLIDPCRTRWVQKLHSLDVFFMNYESVLNALDEMYLNEKRNYDRKTSSEAASYEKLMTNYNFIVVLVITKNLMDYFHSITKILQTKDFDIAQRNEQIENLKVTLKQIRENVDKEHDSWYKIAHQLAMDNGISEKLPRRCLRQIYRANYGTNSPSVFYKQSVTIPLLDHMISHMEARFNYSSLVAYKGLAAIPDLMIKQVKAGKQWKENFLEFAKFYESDLPFPNLVTKELNLWENFWIGREKNWRESLPKTVSETLKKIDIRGFPNIGEALLISGTLPITTCECERSISVIRRLKNYSRSTMTEARFNSLALMQIHQDIYPDVDRVIDIFASKKRRRLELLFTTESESDSSDSE